MSGIIVVAGRKPVLEALRSGVKVEAVTFQKGIKGELLNEIRETAGRLKIPITELENKKFSDFTRGHEPTQGVAARVHAFRTLPLHEIIKLSGGKNKLLLALDSVQDPHNFGAIIRSAECAGVDGIITTKHSSAPLNMTVFKTSAGAAVHIPVCEVSNLTDAIKECKEAGFWSVGLALEEKPKVQKIDYTLPLLIIVGNEEKGLRRLVKQNCDFILTIPMMGNIESLNVSVATGVALFNALRERGVW
ncbi:MAG: 23S rRNA (guanosine(2251)-2'-O)-methyltransferase RlmB [Ignavibacteriales bacterium]|nr:MAG: 23S rRNA (guanosine(2251)-2'-O)-methyltransferase RlmB [Ignavibacteriaceae bacterium]MBW7872775.1 23S rRNA (guanosine(2251)-2'-O)-methyltransferase RlmB [Ignavibacteria bacterium]MCZ2143495.1 23S rRNA (guanosine(2251)-2'-O)-methyltransferase RlmB [Ignavibacteriales bacterium]OQY72512.1 MAG: 23S rRNA (guanosine(2251)-2'-O)-methyltransferase RlmB [Ignavibacteriales bacterium UTCHB3]MBV6444372.1 putative TrmH family tRNA/rRNA methyltransferase [Ignavibacteriaceae bacterium]